MDNSSKSDAKSSSVSRPSQVVKDSVLHRRSKIPEAYRVKEFRGRLYIVPKFLDLSTESAVAAIEERDKLQMKVDDPYSVNGCSTSNLAGIMKTPVDPSLTQYELLTLHSKIKGLQDHLGLSYKDAVHRLYMAELERLQVADEAAKAFSMMKNKIDTIITQELLPVVRAVDHWAVDGFVYQENGGWSTED